MIASRATPKIRSRTHRRFFGGRCVLAHYNKTY